MLRSSFHTSRKLLGKLCSNSYVWIFAHRRRSLVANPLHLQQRFRKEQLCQRRWKAASSAAIRTGIVLFSNADFITSLAETVKVPQMAESITEGTLKQWTKQVGDHVEADEEVATIETDKVRPGTILSISPLSA